jgi:hypothetical protein
MGSAKRGQKKGKMKKRCDSEDADGKVGSRSPFRFSYLLGGNAPYSRNSRRTEVHGSGKTPGLNPNSLLASVCRSYGRIKRKTVNISADLGSWGLSKVEIHCPSRCARGHMLGCQFRDGVLDPHFRAVLFSIPVPIGFWGAKPPNRPKYRDVQFPGTTCRNRRTVRCRKRCVLARRNLLTPNFYRGNARSSGKMQTGRKTEKETEKTEGL